LAFGVLLLSPTRSGSLLQQKAIGQQEPSAATEEQLNCRGH
jgi:hypothetical protein